MTKIKINKSFEGLKNFSTLNDIPKVIIDSTRFNDLSYAINNVQQQGAAINKLTNDSIKSIQNERFRKEQYEQDVLNTLRQIEGNTANLTVLVNLIQTSNDNQAEILEIVTELLSLAKEKDTEVVNSKYREIMNKITTFTNDVQVIATLAGFATTVLNILKSGA